MRSNLLSLPVFEIFLPDIVRFEMRLQRWMAITSSSAAKRRSPSSMLLPVVTCNHDKNKKGHSSNRAMMHIICRHHHASPVTPTTFIYDVIFRKFGNDDFQMITVDYLAYFFQPSKFWLQLWWQQQVDLWIRDCLCGRVWLLDKFCASGFRCCWCCHRPHLHTMEKTVENDALTDDDLFRSLFHSHQILKHALFKYTLIIESKSSICK